MPATAITNCITTPSTLPDFCGGAGWPFAFSLVSVETDLLFCGVRSCLLKYSDDVSRRIGVACLERAIAPRRDKERSSLLKQFETQNTIVSSKCYQRALDLPLFKRRIYRKTNELVRVKEAYQSRNLTSWLQPESQPAKKSPSHLKLNLNHIGKNLPGGVGHPDPT